MAVIRPVLAIVVAAGLYDPSLQTAVTPVGACRWARRGAKREVQRLRTVEEQPTPGLLVVRCTREHIGVVPVLSVLVPGQMAAYLGSVKKF